MTKPRLSEAKIRAMREYRKTHTIDETIQEFGVSRYFVARHTGTKRSEFVHPQEAELSAAVRDVLDGGMGQKAAADKHGVNVSTLQTRIVRERNRRAAASARLHPAIAIGALVGLAG